MVRRALEEDLGLAGDITTSAVVPPDATAAASIVARQSGRIAGMDVAAAAFLIYDDRLRWEALVEDGDDVEPGATLATITGPARGVLTAERVALNFLGHMCGTATVTRDMVAAVGNHRARIVGTRKTTPGIRALEKHAVRMGGGYNHRFGLDDAVLIKDNHLAIAGGVRAAVARARRAVGHVVMIEVEVDTLQQLEAALEVGVNAVLLDNMDLDTLRRAVELTAGRAITEASGGITPDTAEAIAATGVDLLSVGWLTHSAPNLDVGLDIA
ncbi:MAG: carboxylating nicotinate-nucleotide diphosphorylase [Anaerolineae bacterium]